MEELNGVHMAEYERREEERKLITEGERGFEPLTTWDVPLMLLVFRQFS